MEPFIIIFIFIAGLLTGIMSGVSGGGGGMLTIPLFIFLGLSPQQAVATNKMNGLGAAFGGLSVFWKSGYVRKDIIKVMIPLAVIIGVTTPFIFITLDSNFMQKVIAVLLLLMVPTLFLRNKNHKKPSKNRLEAGYICYSIVLSMQALFGTGVGTLALYVMTLLFGTSKLEAAATKRAVTAVLTPLSFIALFVAGFVHFSYGLAILLGSFIGTNLGSRIALKKGEAFVTYTMAIVTSLSGLYLLFS